MGSRLRLYRVDRNKGGSFGAIAHGMKGARSVVRSADREKKDLIEMGMQASKDGGSAGEVGVGAVLQYSLHSSSFPSTPHLFGAGASAGALGWLPAPHSVCGKASHSCTSLQHPNDTSTSVYLLASSLTVVLDPFTCTPSPLLIRHTILSLYMAIER